MLKKEKTIEFIVNTEDEMSIDKMELCPIVVYVCFGQAAHL